MSDKNYMEKRWYELAKMKCLPKEKLEKRMKAGQATPENLFKTISVQKVGC